MLQWGFLPWSQELSLYSLLVNISCLELPITTNSDGLKQQKLSHNSGGLKFKNQSVSKALFSRRL